jgi:hypothetical protein
MTSWRSAWRALRKAVRRRGAMNDTAASTAASSWHGCRCMSAVQAAGDCQGTIHLTATGTAAGPYPGTFQEMVTFVPLQAEFSATFVIESGDVTINGTKRRIRHPFRRKQPHVAFNVGRVAGRAVCPR